MNGLVIGVTVLAVVVLVEFRQRSLRRRTVTGRWWPWLVGVIERELDVGGADLPTATVRACKGGPPPLRRAAESAVRKTGGVDAIAVVGALRDRVDNAVGDQVFGTVAALHIRGGPTDTVLAWVRADASVAAAHQDARAAVGAGGTVARWLLLAPVAPGIGGQLPGAAGWCAAVVAVGLWWGAGRWLRERPDARVFAWEPIGPLA